MDLSLTAVGFVIQFNHSTTDIQQFNNPENMLAFILVNNDSDIFDAIAAIGVLLAGIGLTLNARANYIAIINKCTSEFRSIVRILQSDRLPDGYSMSVLEKDLCGLFNEQLYYMKKWYLPASFRREWKKTIICYLFNNNGEIEIHEEEIKKHRRLYQFYQKQKRKRDTELTGS